jgi:Acetyltransferase (GNAT) domain
MTSQESIKIHAGDPQDSWTESLRSFARSRSLLLPQLLPIWAPIFRSINDYNYSLLVAKRNNAIVGYLPFVQVGGPMGAFVQSTALLAYGGPVSDDPTVAKELVSSLVERSREAGAVSLTIGLPPFDDELTCSAVEEALQPEYRHENFFQYSLLNEHPLDQMTKKRRSAFRSEIARARSSGLILDDRPTSEDLTQWLDVYEARYREIGARPYPRAFFEGIHRTLLPAGHAAMIVARHEGAVIGGTIFLLGIRTADYFATAFRTEWMSQYPATWVLDEMFTRLIADGFTHFNWESSPGREGVYQFKQRWGAVEGRHSYCTRILGDVAPWIARPKEDVSRYYPGCFVLPFSLWPAGNHTESLETSA